MSSEKNPRKENKKILSFYLKGGLVRVWEKLVQMPDYINAQDLFRDMVRFFAKAKGIIKPNATGEEDDAGEQGNSESDH